MFTSLEQERHGVRFVGDKLGEGCDTLAELFHEAGYRTAAFVQNPVAAPRSGLGRGFERFQKFVIAPEATGHVLAEAVAELRDTDEPCLVYVHLLAPHMPYLPQAGFAGRFGGDREHPANGSTRSLRHVAGKGPEHPDVRNLSALYDEYLCWVDALIGDLMIALQRERGRQPVVIFTSDHGEAFGEHGAFGHNTHVYDEMTRVPLIVVAEEAGFVPGSVSREPVSTLDLLPTLVELFSLPEPRQTLRGRPLPPTDDVPGELRALLTSSRYVDPEEGELRPAQYGLVLGDFKLIADGELAAFELYDLVRDPRERQDLAQRDPERVELMSRLLARSLEEAARDEQRGGSFEPDAESERALHDLGYTEDDGR
jgi:arylsulfatase A-like enzyme